MPSLPQGRVGKGGCGLPREWGLGTYWSGNEGMYDGRNDFWGLPWTRPLHWDVRKGAEMDWFREENWIVYLG